MPAEASPAAPEPRVAVLMGSDSDLPVMAGCVRVLEEYGIGHEVRVLSAHRSPDEATRFCREAEGRGLRVIVAGAGGAAHLAGVAAAHTTLPVIGVPLAAKTGVMNGLDALLSVAQMPPGVPVACVGVDNARNAAVLAAKILDA
jgi:phosphoribosylaminoimidazole carboxylase PurE protein